MDYLDAIVLNGLKQTSLASLRAMWRQLTEAPLVCFLILFYTIIADFLVVK